MPPVGFEPTTLAGERSRGHSDRHLTEIACVGAHPLALLDKQSYLAPGKAVNLGDDRIEEGSFI